MSKPARKYQSDEGANFPPAPRRERLVVIPQQTLRWGSLALALALLYGAPAQADSTVIVLSMRALDGDDALAHRLSDALRSEAATIPGWQVSDREVSLAQMSLAHGCTETSANCMADIAKTLEVDRLVYGSSERTTDGIHVTLQNYDAVTGHVEGTYDNMVPEEAIEDDSLDATARRMAEQLAGKVILGSIRVQVNVPHAEVYLDDQHVGVVQAADSLVLHDVPAGPHALAVESDGHRKEKQIDVPAGVEAQAVFALTAVAPVMAPAEPISSPPGEPSEERPASESPRLRIAGYTTLGLAGGLLIGTGIIWGRLEALNEDEDLMIYRDMFPGPDEPGGTSDVCIEARAGDPGDRTHQDIADRVAEVCDKGDLLEKLQWVFLSAGVAAVGAGTTLLLVDRKHRRRDMALSFSPRLGRGRAGLNARLTF